MPRLRCRLARPARQALPYLLAILAAALSGLALLPKPAAAPPPPKADYVIIGGVAGLRWEDVDPVRTPALWQLARRGAIGALSVRSAQSITCPGDGWLTLGAGNRARRTAGPVDGHCPVLEARIDQAAGGAVTLADQRSVVHDNRQLPWDVQPGALAEAVRCTTAVGPGGAVAAARPFGRIDRYLPGVGNGLGGQLEPCSLAIVDLGTVDGTGTARQAGARAADWQLAQLLATRPEHSLVIVAGLADTADTGRLHVAVAEGPGYQRGWLTSATTGRTGYLQLVDLAPTALAALDRPAPKELFAGGMVERRGGRPGRLAVAVDRLADADRQADVQRVVAARFLILLAVGQILLFAAMVPVLHQARRTAGPQASQPLPGRLRLAAEVLLVAASLAVPAALVADLVPWWRERLAGPLFTGVMIVALAVATAVVVAVTRRWRAIGPLAAVAAVTAVAVAADVMTGARLQLNGVAGYSATAGGRYSGMGTIGLGVFVAGVLLLAGALATRVPRMWRPCAVAAVGAVGVVVVGSPYLGADAAGAVALSAGVCLAAAAASGGWFTLQRFAAAALTGVAVTGGFALLDLTRPAQQRSNIGRFLVDLGDGTGGLAGERIGEHNVGTIASSPLSLLVFGSVGFILFVLLRPRGGLLRVFGLYPALRGALGGIALATVFAGLVEGVGLNVLGAAMATAVPLATLTAVRVLDHASDRTVPLTPAGEVVVVVTPPAGDGLVGAAPAAVTPPAGDGPQGAAPAVAGGVTPAGEAGNGVPGCQPDDPAPVVGDEVDDTTRQ